MDFIKDENRESIFKWVDLRVQKNRSIMIIGETGSGKTELGKKLKEIHNLIQVSPFGTVTQLLGEMNGVTDVQKWRGSSHYLHQLKRHPKRVLMDEAQELDRRIFPRMKELMDCGNTFVLLGREPLVDIMEDYFPDLMDRFLRVDIEPLSIDDFEVNLPMFDKKALMLIDGKDSSMRVKTDIMDDCLRYIKENGMDRVTVEVVEEFIGN